MFAQGMNNIDEIEQGIERVLARPGRQIGIAYTPLQIDPVCRLNLLLNVWVRPGWLRPCIPDRIVNYLSARQSLANLSGEIGDVLFPNGRRHDLTSGGIDRGDYRAFGVRRLHLQIDVIQPNAYVPGA